MVFAILLLVFQPSYEDAFTKLAREIGKVVAEHLTSVNASKTETGKDEITRKNNERLLEIANGAMGNRMEFEYQIRGVDRDSNGDFSVTLDPDLSSTKSELVKRRSLTIPVTKELGESIFPGDLLVFTGKLRMGADPRSKQAVPFAVIRPEGLKLLAVWIDEIEVGESKPDVKVERSAQSEVLTPKSFVSEIDRVFKQARSEIATGKTSADKQDIADKHSKIIVETIEKFDDQVFEFETKIKDVVRGEAQNEYRVIVSHSDPIKWFSNGGAPLQTVGTLNFSIVGEDRSEFLVGRNIIVRGKISVTIDQVMGTNFARVYLGSGSVANDTAKVPQKTLVLTLREIETEFVPEKSGSKPTKK